MFDGMGGPNGVLPHHLGRITPGQLQGWWIAPLAAMNRTMNAPPTAAQSAATADLPGPMTLAEFRAAFGGNFPGRPDEWWATKHAEWNEEAKNG